jgi:MFS family permease
MGPTYSIAAVATATAPGYWWFIAFRRVTALDVGGEYSAVTSAIAEFTPARNRGRSNGVLITFCAVCGILAGLGSIVVIPTLGLTWRYTRCSGVLSAGCGLLARRLIPESPQWLAAHDRLANADRVYARWAFSAGRCF